MAKLYGSRLKSHLSSNAMAFGVHVDVRRIEKYKEGFEQLHLQKKPAKEYYRRGGNRKEKIRECGEKNRDNAELDGEICHELLRILDLGLNFFEFLHMECSKEVEKVRCQSLGNKT